MVRRMLVASLLLLAPVISHALQLHWASGSTGLSFVEATRCTLVVHSDFADGTFPSELRLAWVTNHCRHITVLPDTVLGDGTTTQVVHIEPQSLADARGNMTTAVFDSLAPDDVTGARWILDLPAGSAGNFEAIARTPGGKTIRSAVASFNGGVSASFAPIILSSSSSHATSRLVISAFGTDLGQSNSATVMAPDTVWRVPLNIIEHSDSTLTAIADVPALLPESVFEVGTSSSPVATQAPLSAESQTASTASVCTEVVYHDPGFGAGVAVKDFAFAYNFVPTAKGWRQLYHLIYIRHEANGAETTYGHAWSPDLCSWQTDIHAFATSSSLTNWDGQQLFAPTLIQVGPSWHLVYSATSTVGQTFPPNSKGDESIGYATTQLLDTTNTNWARRPTASFTAPEAPSWVDPAEPYNFRDPYVLPDPTSAGHYLMVYTAANVFDPPNNAIGLARNRTPTTAFPGVFDRWEDLGFYHSTVYSGLFIATAESPHLVQDPSGHWRMFVTAAGSPDANSIAFLNECTSRAVTDTSGAAWGNKKVLVDYLGGLSGGGAIANGWRGTEFLAVPPGNFLAAYVNGGIRITKLNWDPILEPNSFCNRRQEFTLDAALTGVDEGDRGASQGVHLRLDRSVRGTLPASFQIDLGSAMLARLDVYDLSGRRIQTLINRRLPKGASTISWNCLDRSGSTVSSGVYFARLIAAAGTQSIPVIILR